MMTALLAGTKIPRPRPASPSSGIAFGTVTGMKADAHMTAQVAVAPTKPRRLSAHVLGSTESDNADRQPLRARALPDDSRPGRFPQDTSVIEHLASSLTAILL
jgi:hypothetical protein